MKKFKKALKEFSRLAAFLEKEQSRGEKLLAAAKDKRLGESRHAIAALKRIATRLKTSAKDLAAVHHQKGLIEKAAAQAAEAKAAEKIAKSVAKPSVEPVADKPAAVKAKKPVAAAKSKASKRKTAA